ncbi:acetoacetyl-CoA synthetase [Nephila pilipes]|uniref:Acetoacetyl-CoA synthetase n=1 Tax=Nephila pilipes TaxID=299642 RepID=A0A8X6NXB8_NEPPI|nr:acetoacetyl-CoA synthetase [Nephila pilipes]
MAVANFILINFDTARDSRWISVMPAGTAIWQVHLTTHFLGQTLLLYEGAPYLLNPTSFWDVLEKHKISHILMFPRALDEMEKRNHSPCKLGDLIFYAQ